MCKTPKAKVSFNAHSTTVFPGGAPGTDGNEAPALGESKKVSFEESRFDPMFDAFLCFDPRRYLCCNKLKANVARDNMEVSRHDLPQLAAFNMTTMID